MSYKGRPVETLEIENFLSIRKAKIEIKPMTVLIGDNAVGKSVISKLVYMMRELFLRGGLRGAFLDAVFEGRDYVDKDSLRQAWKFFLEDYFRDIFPVQYYETNNFSISYKVDNRTIVSITRTKGRKVRVNLGRKFFEWVYDTLLNLISQELPARLEIEDNGYEKVPKHAALVVLRVVDRLSAQTFNISNYIRNVFVPHARTMYLYMDLLDIEKRYERFDELMRFFLDVTEGLSNFIRKKLSFIEESILKDYLKYESTVIKGKLSIEDDNVYIVIGDQEFDIYHVSSGQQELLPLILLLRYGLILRRSGGVLRLCVEEPETHLFPTTQRDLTYLFGYMHNLNTEFLITTHSPYILTSLNNLLFAKRLYKKSKRKEIKEKYGKIWIDTKDVAAYEVKDGYVKNIIDEEGLIEAENIDIVSDEIGDEIDNMLELAYEKDKEKENRSK